mmetsp:Transcript_61996/g.136368  ORF Transcript_61996/g.136368 Transcript_61996/m.136368 type:complete len:400 (+) Transcript_61996:343-1542(+)
MDELAEIYEPVVLRMAFRKAAEEGRLVWNHLNSCPRNVVDVGVELLRSLSDERGLFQHSANLAGVAGTVLVEHLGVVLGEPVDRPHALNVGLLEKAAQHHHEVFRAELRLYRLLVLLYYVRDGHEDRRERLSVWCRPQVDPLADRGDQLLEVGSALFRQGAPDELHKLLHALTRQAQGVEELGEPGDAGLVLRRHCGVEAPPHHGAELLFSLSQDPYRGVIGAWWQSVLRGSESRHVLGGLLVVFRGDGPHYLVGALAELEHVINKLQRLCHTTNHCIELAHSPAELIRHARRLLQCLLKFSDGGWHLLMLLARVGEAAALALAEVRCTTVELLKLELEILLLVSSRRQFRLCGLNGENSVAGRRRGLCRSHSGRRHGHPAGIRPAGRRRPSPVRPGGP